MEATIIATFHEVERVLTKLGYKGMKKESGDVRRGTHLSAGSDSVVLWKRQLSHRLVKMTSASRNSSH
jgi:hypothetical protein